VTSITEDLDPALAAVLQRAFLRPVGVETAARHLWTIDHEGTKLQQVATAPRRLRKAAVAALTSALLVGSSSAAVAASGPALPGDLLYSVKLGSEQARLLIALSPEADARVHLEIARRRMAEARRAAVVRPEVVDQLVADALGQLDAAERAGGAELAGEVAEVRTEAARTVADLDVTVDAGSIPRGLPAPPPTSGVVTPPALPAVPPIAVPEPPAETGTAGATPSPAPASTPTSEPDPPPPSPQPSQRPSEPVVAPPSAPAPAPSPSPSPSASPSPTARPSPASSQPTFQGLEPTPSPSPSATPSSSPTPSETPSG